MDTAGTARATLSAEECLVLLRTKSVGRIAYTDRALPAIGLVSYSMLNGMVLLRSDKSLWIALRDAVVAFQSDDVDGPDGADWSVTCVGKVNAVPGLDDVLVLDPTLVSGWRVASAGVLPITPEAARAS